MTVETGCETPFQCGAVCFRTPLGEEVGQGGSSFTRHVGLKQTRWLIMNDVGNLPVVQEPQTHICIPKLLCLLSMRFA
jgi:hypothetical protein